jgi:predicted TIM-barrel fold metal-dependent hydrolase
MAIVESHAHLYSQDEQRYPTADNPSRPPAGTGTVEHLERMRNELGITHVVAVQTFSFYGHDNRLVVDSVAAHPDWMVGVCNLPSDGPSSPDDLARLVDGGGVRGLRLEHPPGGGRFYHPGSVALCAKARELGLVVNIHAGGTDFYPDATRLLTEFPELTFCLDHCGYQRPDLPDVEAAVLGLAQMSNLHLKMSFWSERDAEYIAIGQRLLDAFGPERCMWGGNFPGEHWHPKLPYVDHLAVMRDEICRSQGEREATLGATPLRVWFPDQA